MALHKVPYILCILISRFEYDWERDMRVKINDRASFAYSPFVHSFHACRDQVVLFATPC